ncbi:putative predicted protein [Rhizobium favelukesii]|uniref:Uncharacterized protein n=1 Tax=Rhizobium favelukesii TaxID=348824 RepID=W6RFV3_9HYPH|nr:putative predicted protein [Rhizobium favelukesii]
MTAAARSSISDRIVFQKIFGIAVGSSDLPASLEGQGFCPNQIKQWRTAWIPQRKRAQ